MVSRLTIALLFAACCLSGCAARDQRSIAEIQAEARASAARAVENVRPRSEAEQIALARQVTILGSQIFPFTTKDGLQVQKLRVSLRNMRVSLRNNGPRPLAAVFCNLRFYDAAGAETMDSIEEWCVASDDSHGSQIMPGQVYTTPAGDEHILFSRPPFGERSVRVSIIPYKAWEQGE